MLLIGTGFLIAISSFMGRVLIETRFFRLGYIILKLTIILLVLGLIQLFFILL